MTAVSLNTVKGRVRALDGDSALIEVEQGGCGRCHEEGGCGGQNLTQMFCSDPRLYRVENRCQAVVGDRVTIATDVGNLRKTANLAYVWPLLAIIFGALLGTYVNGDMGAMFGAALGLALAYVYVGSKSSRAGNSPESGSYIVSRE